MRGLSTLDIQRPSSPDSPRHLDRYFLTLASTKSSLQLAVLLKNRGNEMIRYLG